MRDIDTGTVLGTEPPHMANQGKINALIHEYVPSFEEMVWDWGTQVDLTHRIFSPVTRERIPFYTVSQVSSRTFQLRKDDGYELVYRNGFIRHTNPLSASIAWRELFEGMVPSLALLKGDFHADPLVIPISPILRFKDADGKFAQIWTRYSGLSVGYYKDIYLTRLTRIFDDLHRYSGAYGEEATILSARVQKLSEQIEAQQAVMQKKLEQLYYFHGHATYSNPYMTHEGNLTVEFIDAAYLEEMRAQGYTVNSLPYKRECVTFDPREYFRGLPIVPLVRLIDFSEASFHNLRLKDALSSSHIHPSLFTLRTLLSSDRPYQQALAKAVMHFLNIHDVE